MAKKKFRLLQADIWGAHKTGLFPLKKKKVRKVCGSFLTSGGGILGSSFSTIMTFDKQVALLHPAWYLVVYSTTTD